MNPAFPFGPDFQRACLRLMLEDEPFCGLACKHFEPSFFDNDGLAWTFRAVRDYWQSYAATPTSLVLRENVRTLPPNVAPLVSPVVESVLSVPLREEEFVATKVVEFIRRNRFVEGFEHTRAIYNSGDADKAYEYWARCSEDLQKIRLDHVDRTFFFHELEGRQGRREAYHSSIDSHTFSTGIGQLDSILNGGLSRGEMGAWIAYQKMGKSMLLVWLAFYAVRALRIPVLYVVLEGSREYVEERFDACFADTPTALVARGEISHGTYQAMMAEYAQLKDLLVLRAYTKDAETWAINAGHIAAELKELKVAHGYRPDMIVVDYADLMRARGGAQSETQHQTEAWKDLKSLTAKDHGYALWTASQAQRKPPKADHDPSFLVRAENVADAIGKVRVVDFYGSLNQTIYEKDAGQMRLFAEDYRSGRAQKVITVDTDYERGRFMRSVVHMRDAPPPPPPEPEAQDLPGVPA